LIFPRKSSFCTLKRTHTRDNCFSTMPNPPTVSVLLPVYNAERYLREAIGSILTQTFADFELIAVDDGSTDRSPAILSDLAARDPRIRIITRPNGGIASALNDGLAAATGEFIARMDADDISLPQRFERQVEYLRAHPDCVLLGSRVLLVDPFDTPLYESNHGPDHEEIERLFLGGEGWAVVHPAAMMRTAAMRSAGGYRTEYVPIEDLDLFLRLLEPGGRAANLPDVLLHYRQHANSANRTRFAEQEEKKRACVADAYQRRGRPFPADWAPPPRRQLMPAEELRQWAWAAVNRRRAGVARRHAIRVLGMQPFARSSWKLMYCALRGR
jgi:glycosyltransferase involved in cell wall biosynthesis